MPGGAPTPRKPRRFFSWIRSTGMMRGDDRWIGGVCSGLAARLGWSPTLTRALLTASVLLFGFGAAVYAFAWLLLPDARTGHILVEDLIDGHWQWDCLGALLCMAVAIVIPGFGWLAIALAAAFLWFLAQSSIRQSEGYGYAYRAPSNKANGTPDSGMSGAGMSGPAVSGTAAPYGSGSGTPGSAAPYAAGSAAHSVSGPTAFGSASQGETSAYAASAASGPSAAYPTSDPAHANKSSDAGFRDFPANPYQPYAAARNSQPSGFASAAPAAAAAMPTPAGYRAPQQPAPAGPRYARRKPAGPTLVLSLLGLALLSAAILMGVVSLGLVPVGPGDVMAMATAWICAVCIVLGLTLVVLGVRGCRSGGLIPVTLIAGFTAVCMMFTSLGYAYLFYQAEHNTDSYAQVDFDRNYESRDADGMRSVQGPDGARNYWVADYDGALMARLEQGVRFNGYSYASSVANIDMSEAKTCPTGQINIAANRAQVQVTVPDGCRYVFSNRWGGAQEGITALGGPWSVVTDNNVNLTVGPTFDGGYEYGYGYEYANDDWDEYGWDEDGYAGDDPNHYADYLRINVDAIGGRVSVVQAFDSQLPGYVEFSRSVK